MFLTVTAGTMFSILKKVPINVANPFKAIKLDDSFSRFNRVYLFAWSILCAIVIALNDYAGEFLYPCPLLRVPLALIHVPLCHCALCPVPVPVHYPVPVTLLL